MSVCSVRQTSEVEVSIDSPKGLRKSVLVFALVGCLPLDPCLSKPCEPKPEAPKPRSPRQQALALVPLAYAVGRWRGRPNKVSEDYRPLDP